MDGGVFYPNKRLTKKFVAGNPQNYNTKLVNYLKKDIKNKMKLYRVPSVEEYERKKNFPREILAKLPSIAGLVRKILCDTDRYDEKYINKTIKKQHKIMVKNKMITKNGKIIIGRKQVGIRNDKPVYKNLTKISGKPNNYKIFMSDALRKGMTFKDAVKAYWEAKAAQIPLPTGETMMGPMDQPETSSAAMPTPMPSPAMPAPMPSTLIMPEGKMLKYEEHIPELTELADNGVPLSLIDQMHQRFMAQTEEDKPFLPRGLTKPEFLAYPRSKPVVNPNKKWASYLSLSKQGRRVGRGSEYTDFVGEAMRGGMSMSQAAAAWRNRN